MYFGLYESAMSEMDQVKSGINRHFHPDPSIPPQA